MTFPLIGSSEKKAIFRSFGLSRVLTVLILCVVLGARRVDDTGSRLVILFVFVPQQALSEGFLLTKRKCRKLELTA